MSGDLKRRWRVELVQSGAAVELEWSHEANPLPLVSELADPTALAG